VKLGAKWREHNPVTLVAFEPGQYAGAKQRGFSRTGGAQHDNHPGPALRPPCVEPLYQSADIIVAAEINCRICLIEGKQPRIGRTRRVPIEPAARINYNLGQFRGKEGQTAFAVLHKIEMLDVL